MLNAKSALHDQAVQLKKFLQSNDQPMSLSLASDFNSSRRGGRTVRLCNTRHLGIGVDFFKVLLVARGCRFDAVVAGVPVRRADLR
jgi:hypothetical protein